MRIALVTCTACGREVTDRLTICPHCGDPVAVERNEQPAGAAHTATRVRAHAAPPPAGWLAAVTLIGAASIVQSHLPADLLSCAEPAIARTVFLCHPHPQPAALFLYVVHELARERPRAR